MQFRITAYDSTEEGALERRMQIRPQHLENMAKVMEKNRVICAGAITGENGGPIGSFLIMEFEDRDALDAYLAAEPYVTGGVWADVKVETCHAVIIDNRF